MGKLLLGICVFTTFCFAHSNPLPWTLAQSANGVQVYQHQDKPHLRLTVENRLSASGEFWNLFKAKDFIQQMNQRKRKSLAQLGIKDWKIKNQKWSQNESAWTYEGRGSYQDPEGLNVYFFELHHFGERSTRQMLLSSTDAPINQLADMKKSALEFLRKQGAWE